MRSRSVLITGAGGVGKTTLSAAVGIAAARAGLHTLVVTVDPAKRLAHALGLDELPPDPTPNPHQENLWAAMLDATASWERIIERHAPPDVAERLIENEFFRAIADRFPASQSYAAAEEMANYLEANVWEVVVVDTPPSGGGIDFFAAPSDIRELVGGRILRWLTGARMPGRKTFYTLAGRPVLRVADAVLGTDLLQRIAEFLLDLRTTYDGLTRRAREIEHYFEKASIAVVTTADPGPVREAARFFRELPEVAARPSAVVFNRTLPAEWQDPSSIEVPAADRTAARIVDNLARWGGESHRQAEARSEFGARYRTEVVEVPWMSRPPETTEDLSELANKELMEALRLQ